METTNFPRDGHNHTCPIRAVARAGVGRLSSRPDRPDTANSVRRLRWGTNLSACRPSPSRSPRPAGWGRVTRRPIGVSFASQIEARCVSISQEGRL
jgi:hypothetical protein